MEEPSVTLYGVAAFVTVATFPKATVTKLTVRKQNVVGGVASTALQFFTLKDWAAPVKPLATGLQLIIVDIE